MQVPPKSNHAITPAEASVLTANYRRRSTSGIKGGLFWKEAIENVVRQTGCIAMRYYYAQKDDGTPAIVLVGVDANGHDMTGGFLADLSFPCPPYCDEPNVLNHGTESIRLQRGPIRYKTRLPQHRVSEINAVL
jgi:hypothetical protein